MHGDKAIPMVAKRNVLKAEFMRVAFIEDYLEKQSFCADIPYGSVKYCI